MMMVLTTKRNVWFLLLALVPFASAWVSPRSPSAPVAIVVRPFSSALIRQAGFGGASKDKKEKKLKPKQQWDRFLGLKKETRVPVGVRIASQEWMPVGHVKSADNQYTVAAVNLQKGIIADHAKRLFPAKISPKDKLEWAHQNEQGEWVVAEATQKEERGLEKKIGFAGTPDPASGFYCVYNEGRLVTGDSDLPSASKKVA